MSRFEVIDITLKTELINTTYELEITPRKGEFICISNITYVITDIIHNLDTEINTTVLLVQPVKIKYGAYLN